MKIKELLTLLNENDDLDSLLGINDAYIFLSLFNLYESSDRPVWLSSRSMALNYAFDYYYSHSGEKDLSLYAHNTEIKHPAYIAEDESKHFPFNDYYARLLKMRFAEKWTRLYNAIYADYNPVNNYDMTEQENVKTNVDTTATNSVYGFNSTEAVPASTTEGNTSGASGNNERILTRSGNIGVTTSQQMIESEIELRKNNFIEIMFNDIDSVLALEIYS